MKDKIYQKHAVVNMVKNKFSQPVHSHEYAQKYHEVLHRMVENQMQFAIAAAANFWYTAWVDAGKPNLNDLDPAGLTDRNSKNYKKDMRLWKKGQLFRFNVENEF